MRLRPVTPERSWTRACSHVASCGTHAAEALGRGPEHVRVRVWCLIDRPLSLRSSRGLRRRPPDAPHTYPFRTKRTPGHCTPRPTLVHIGVARRGRVSGPDRTTTRAPEVHPM